MLFKYRCKYYSVYYIIELGSVLRIAELVNYFGVYMAYLQITLWSSSIFSTMYLIVYHFSISGLKSIS